MITNVHFIRQDQFGAILTATGLTAFFLATVTALQNDFASHFAVVSRWNRRTFDFHLVLTFLNSFLNYRSV